ncbi:protein translocase subunit SecD [Acidaminococcus fermentans]|uniref:protein translocase subunit SecD n=1 Tax=Acidaminococcus fermentans TaxID=905 RepID=UPI003077569A
MESKNRAKLLVSVLAIVIAFAVFIKPLVSMVKQGLDLQGGTHVVLQAQETPESKVDDDAINRSIQIISRRVNELGLTEPVIQRQGKDKIIVELPGVKDPEQAIAMLGKTAMLEFKDMEGNTVLTGKDLKDSKASADQSGQPVVTLQFNEDGAKKFADLTARNVGRQIAILLDGKVLTAPRVSEPITGGNAQITGSKDAKEAEHLAILLRSGSLPVKLEVVENRTVGPTLGQDAKDASMKAFAIGLAGVFLFMLLYYRLSGLVADIVLLLYTLLLLAVMKGLNATLTLPGMAGIILSIGMAVDANVLIFERFKEEIANGKTLRAAVSSGFSRAFTTILDSNVTTLMAAAVLFYLGTGPIKGFAVTLALGVLISMFTAVTVTKFILGALIGSNFTKNPAWFGAKAFQPKAKDGKGEAAR